MSALSAVVTTAYLTAYCSERDRDGNCYWAMKFHDVESGKEICGLISGDDSNIRGIMRYWNVVDDWDRGIQFDKIVMKRSAFKKLTAGWEYAGCVPNDLANFIRRKLGKPLILTVRADVPVYVTVSVPSNFTDKEAEELAYRQFNSQCEKMMNRNGFDLGEVSTLKTHVYYANKKEIINH